MDIDANSPMGQNLSGWTLASECGPDEVPATCTNAKGQTALGCRKKEYMYEPGTSCRGMRFVFDVKADMPTTEGPPREKWEPTGGPSVPPTLPPPGGGGGGPGGGSHVITEIVESQMDPLHPTWSDDMLSIPMGRRKLASRPPLQAGTGQGASGVFAGSNGGIGTTSADSIFGGLLNWGINTLTGGTVGGSQGCPPGTKEEFGIGPGGGMFTQCVATGGNDPIIGGPEVNPGTAIAASVASMPEQVTVRRCGRDSFGRRMVLGRDGLCYPPGMLHASQRLNKKRARPPVTAADARAIRRADRARKRLVKLTKKSGAYASMTKPTKKHPKAIVTGRGDDVVVT